MVSRKQWKPFLQTIHFPSYSIISEWKFRPGIGGRLSIFESDVADRFQLAFQVVDDAVRVPSGTVHRFRTILLQSGKDRLTSMQKYISYAMTKTVSGRRVNVDSGISLVSYVQMLMTWNGI